MVEPRNVRLRLRSGRGRDADRPWQIPWRGWLDVAARVKDSIALDNLTVVAGGVAFFWMLAIFPALAAGVALYGMLSDPADVAEQLALLSTVMPADAWRILDRQLHDLVSAHEEGLRMGAVLGALLAVWSTTKGVKALISGLNIAYHEVEKRGFLMVNLTAILLTVGAIVSVLVMLAGIVALPAIIGVLGLSTELEWVISLGRWPVLVMLVVLALGVLYRLAPSRSDPRWQWLTWGSGIATLLWLLASVAFSTYVANFGNFNETYGSLGAVVILLLWFYISAYAILLGAEVNAELEHQTAVDTTTGPEKPLGERGAFVADDLGALRRR